MLGLEIFPCRGCTETSANDINMKCETKSSKISLSTTVLESCPANII